MSRNSWRRRLAGGIAVTLALAVPVIADKSVSSAQDTSGLKVHPAVTAREFRGSLRDLPRVPSWKPGDPTQEQPEGVAEPRTAGRARGGSGRPDPLRQTTTLSAGATEAHGALSSPLVNFDGIATGFQPMDPSGDVGPNHYVQMVNSQFQIFDKAGASLAGPSNINQIWSSAGDTTECATTNSGDPIVVYDNIANRWLLSQFDATGPNFAMCIAISQTPDPTAAYFLYRFVIPQGQGTFPDYPKIGVWPDGYYLSTFEGNLGAYVFERPMMLTGNPARTVEYAKQGILSAPAGFRSTRLMPSDLDGSVPPVGSPNFFLRTVEDVQDGADRLDIFAVSVNWGDPLTTNISLVQSIATAPFSFFSCANDANGAARLCIDQPSGTTQLDALMGRPMWRMQYRNFGSHETLVVNQTVSADGGTNTGIRWYELRRTPAGTGNWVIYQQGTYAPQVTGVTDATWVQRWMGSTAMDGAGNIALAYNVVNADGTNSIFPGIRYTGRLASDPSGILPQGEETAVIGGSVSTATRWGDYTQLSVDPSDDCTFWYTAEYIAASNVRRTRITSFVFPSCSATDISITKTDSPDPVIAGNDLTYSINVANNGSGGATNVVVKDVLPVGVQYQSSSSSCTEAPAGTLTCGLGSLASGASKALTIVVKVPADYVANGGAATLTNTATVTASQTDGNPSNNSATATTQVTESADLRVLKECKPDQPNKQTAGTATFCDIYVDNLGPSAARNVVLTDQVIGGTPFTITAITSSSTSGAAAICPATPIGPTTSTTVTCTDTVLPAGARDTIKVTFSATNAGDVDDTATVSSATSDPVSSNNSGVGRVSFASSSDLALTKTDGPDPVTAGTNLTYILSVTNNGPSAAPNVVVRDTLPAQVSFVSVTPSQGTCQAGVIPGDPTKPLQCNLGSIASGAAAATVTVVVKVNPDVPSGTILVNNGDVSSDSTDPNNDNNVATASTTVVTSADVSIGKTSDATTYKPSTQVKYQVTVTNSGPSKALNVVVTDNLPDVKQAIYQSNTAGCVLSTPTTLQCNVGDLNVGQSKVFFIYVTVKGAQGQVSNTAIVTSSTPDSIAANNTSTRVVTIKGKA